MNERTQLAQLIPESPTESHVDAKLSGAPGFAVKGLFILALFYTCYFARSLLLPIVLALLLSLILSPAVRALKRMFVPEPLGAAADRRRAQCDSRVGSRAVVRARERLARENAKDRRSGRA